MHITVQVRGVEQAQRRVAQVPKQARFAAAGALNDAAFVARDEWVALMQRVFDRPSPYVTSSIWVGKRATASDLSAWIYPRDNGGKGVDPEKVLLAEAHGGVRRPKRFEVALQHAGILPRGLAAVPATWVTVDPTTADGFGGVKGSFITRLLSYLQAFTTSGFMANMSDRRKAQLSGRGRWINGRFYGAHTKKGQTREGAHAVRQGGVEYFVSRGKGEKFTGRGSWKHGQEQHLPAGIWQRTGLYGAVVKPVFLFTRMPRYSARLELRALAERARTETFPPRFAERFRRAMETAR